MEFEFKSGAVMVGLNARSRLPVFRNRPIIILGCTHTRHSCLMPHPGLIAPTPPTAHNVPVLIALMSLQCTSFFWGGLKKSALV